MYRRNELRAFPDGESIGNYDFRKLFKRLVVINRDRLVFVIGSDDLSKLPLNPNAISMGFVRYFGYRHAIIDVQFDPF